MSLISKQDFLFRVKNRSDLLDKMESERRNALLKWGVLPLIASVALFLGLHDYLLSDTQFISVVIVISAIPFVYGCRKLLTFAKEQKAEVLATFFSCFKDLKQTSSTRIIPPVLHGSHIIPWKFEDSEPDDSFSGTLNDIPFSVHEITLGRGYGKSRQEFHATFLDVPFPAVGQNHVLIVPWWDKWEHGTFKRVEVKDAIPLKKQVVFAKNPEQAHQLFTPAFIQKLEQIKALSKGHLRMALFDNRALIALKPRKDLFECYSLVRNAHNLKTYECFYDEVKLIYDIVDLMTKDNRYDAIF